MVLDKLPVPGRPTNLENSRQEPAVLAVGAGGFFPSHLSFLFFLPLSGRRADVDCNTVSKGR